MKKLISILALAAFLIGCQTCPDCPEQEKPELTVNRVSSDAVELYVYFTGSAYCILKNGEIYSYDFFQDKVSSGFFVNDDDLNADTEYTYVLTAYGTYGMASDTLTITTPENPEPPESVDKVTASKSFESVTLEWNAVEGAESYTVKLDGKEFNTTETSLNFENLAPNADYTFIVYAENGAGLSAGYLFHVKTRGAFTASWKRSIDYKTHGGELVENGFAAFYELMNTANNQSVTVQDTVYKFVVGEGIFDISEPCVKVRAVDADSNFSDWSNVVCFEN